MSEISIRQAEIIGLAMGPEALPTKINYTDDENDVWEMVSNALDSSWEQNVAPEVIEASDKLNLPRDHIPQLCEVTDGLRNLSGFEFRAVGGLVPKEEFFAGLAIGKFLSTQYLRHPDTPFYTDQPDVIHEVIGHGTLLADSNFAELHRLAGLALNNTETEAAKQFVANVWWFSGEFGAVSSKSKLKAVGAGLLSSLNELDNFRQTHIEPLDIPSMGTATYQVDELQKRLFVAKSVAHLIDVVGGFFLSASDGQINKLIKGLR